MCKKSPHRTPVENVWGRLFWREGSPNRCTPGCIETRIRGIELTMSTSMSSLIFGDNLQATINGYINSPPCCIIRGSQHELDRKQFSCFTIEQKCMMMSSVWKCCMSCTDWKLNHLINPQYQDKEQSEGGYRVQCKCLYSINDLISLQLQHQQSLCKDNLPSMGLTPMELKKKKKIHHHWQKYKKICTPSIKQRNKRKVQQEQMSNTGKDATTLRHASCVRWRKRQWCWRRRCQSWREQWWFWRRRHQSLQKSWSCISIYALIWHRIINNNWAET